MASLAMKQDASTRGLPMPSDCTMRNISEIVHQARRQLEAEQDIALDCSGVETADFAFVQFVVSAGRSLDARSRTLTLDSAPPAVLSAFSRAGVPLPATTSSLSGAP